jgi:flagellar hook assembly protein FlgD
MEQAGASKTAMKNLSMLSVIGDDPKLVEITITVVKEFAIKYGVTMTADHDVIELKVIDRKDIEA